uniref:LRRNT domain-containing protein n=1 Tax=Anopheles minimus TaxID=112268 RepID=A0A182WJQ9_9DIPT
MGRGNHVLRLISGNDRLLLIATIVTLAGLAGLVEGLGCPTKCSCQQRTVRCIKQQLDKIPEMPPDTNIM